LKCETLVLGAYPEKGIVGNFPEMPVGILEVPAVPAPEYLLRLLYGRCSGAERLCKYSIHSLGALNIVGERTGIEAAGEETFSRARLTRSCCSQFCICRRRGLIGRRRVQVGVLSQRPAAEEL